MNAPLSTPVAPAAAQPAITIRPYGPDDYAGLIALFDDAYAGIDDNYASFEDMEALRRHYPASQLVAVRDGQVVGCILSLLCRYEQFTQPQRMVDIYDPAQFAAHSAGGDSLFALEILVHSGCKRQGIGRLLNQALTAVLVGHNLRAFIGISRLSGYGALQADMAVETYLAQVVAGTLHDPSLSYNCANGMLPTQAVAGYYPADTASAGYGAIVVQPNAHHVPAAHTEVPGSLARMLAGEFDFVHLAPDTLIDDDARQATVAALRELPFQFTYDGMPSCWGKGFENYLTVADYLAPHPNDAAVAALCAPIHARIVAQLHALGIQTAPLVDAVSGREYAQHDFRLGDNAAHQTMLHVDELTQDGAWKADFVLPELLQGRPYRQLMAMVLLDATGGPTTLRSYARAYSPADEVHRQENGWQFADAAVAGSAWHDFQPQAGDAFIMANQRYHDILTGPVASQWLSCSLYMLYLPDLNLALTYV
jgi:ribosomal protein S18 acetylase RimI-like enzyme